MITLGIAWFLFLIYETYDGVNSIKTLDYSQFLTALQDKKVEAVSIGTSYIIGNFRGTKAGEGEKFQLQRVDDPKLIDRLTSAGVKFEGFKEVSFWRDAMG